MALCEKCVHKPVCGKYVATGGHVRECEHFKEERSGRWLKVKEPLGYRDVDCVECSCCHESWIIDEDYEFDDFGGWNYCPNCGADMRGAEDENHLL